MVARELDSRNNQQHRDSVSTLEWTINLGCGKHVFKVWMDRNLIILKHLEAIEEVPSSADRLPSNISSSHGGFTANQWNDNWILIYSPILLKGIQPNEHLRCWLRACSFLKPRFIEKRHIISANLFLQFWVWSALWPKFLHTKHPFTSASQKLPSRLWTITSILVLSVWEIQWHFWINAHQS